MDVDQGASPRKCGQEKEGSPPNTSQHSYCAPRGTQLETGGVRTPTLRQEPLPEAGLPPISLNF